MKQILRLALSALILWTQMLHSEVCIEITNGVNSGRPIAVVPFHWSGPGDAPEEISDIVSADLRNSGKFNPLERSCFPEKLRSIPEELHSSGWPALGIDAVLVGQITPMPDGEYTVAYQLVDIGTGTQQSTVLLQNAYKVNREWLRYAAHTATDEVFEKLTGIKGDFRTRIAYVVQKKDAKFPYELRVSDYDGYNSFTVHRSILPLMSPAWSPDGSHLAYVTFETGHSTLVIQNLSNGSIRQIASFPRHNGAPAFSPDGTKLAFALSQTGSLNLYVMDLLSGQIHQVTNNQSNNTEPSWFPDSKNLAFTSDQSGHPQIYKVNIKGGELERITWGSSKNQNANVSADGKMMVMVSTEDGKQHISKQDLMTGRVQVLSSTFLDESPSLSPNGTMVIYSSSQGMGSVLNLVSIDGRFTACLPLTERQVKAPAWSPYL